MPRKRRHHALGCDCASCMAMVQAALAKNTDGTPFFTVAEMYLMADQIATQEEDNSDVA